MSRVDWKRLVPRHRARVKVTTQYDAFSVIIGSFRLDYEYEASHYHHTYPSSHELLSPPKTNIKNEGSGNITGVRKSYSYSYSILYS